MVPVLEGLSELIRLEVLACDERTSDPRGLEYLSGLPNLDLLPAPRWTSEPENHYLCDLGGTLIDECLERGYRPAAALEGTTSGITLIQNRLAGEEPPFPLFDWNHAPLKREIHNEKMVGSSLWQTFGEVTRLSLHGLSVGVVGFGPVGRGVAREARHRGGCVQILDHDSRAGTVARFEGFPVVSKESLLSTSDVLVTATGKSDIILLEDLGQMRDGAFLLNVGHSPEEIAQPIRSHPARRTVLTHVEEIPSGNGSVFLLAGGGMFNLGAGFGDSINGFDLTSAQLVMALDFLLKEGASKRPGWHHLPPDFDAEPSVCPQL